MNENIPQKAIALTIDDGPRNNSTEKILEVLKKYDAHATFYFIGNQINAETEPIIKKVLEANCEIGNHGMNHGYTDETASEEFNSLQKLLYEKMGEYPKTFRAAGLRCSEAMFEAVNVPVISGYLDCPDWEDQVPLETRVAGIRNNTVDGRILLIHDKIQNIEALEITIPEIINKGYKILTVTELFALKGKEMTKSNQMISEI